MPDQTKPAPASASGNGGGAPPPGPAQRHGTAMLTSKAASVAGLMENENFKREVGRSLARQLDLDRFMRIVLTECRQTPKLFECDPISFAAAVMEMAQLGLEPGPLGHCYLLPFFNKGKLECTLIVGYKGVIHLAWRSKELQSIEARAVKEKDVFDFSYGTGAHVTHKPNVREPRGDSYAYWARAEFKGGGEVFVVLSRSDVEEYRARSKSPKAGPWMTDYDAMGGKTAILRLKPYLPLSPEAAEALERVERYDLGLDGPMADMPTVPAIAEISEDEQRWVDKLNEALPKDKQLSGPGQAKLREEGGYERLKEELSQRAYQAGIDPETGEKRSAPAESKEPAKEKETQAATPAADVPKEEPKGDTDTPAAGGLPGIQQ